MRWGWGWGDLRTRTRRALRLLPASSAPAWRGNGSVSAAPQCFLNAVLQCLSSTRPLRDFCLRRDFRQEVPGGGRAQELTEGGTTPPAPSFQGPVSPVPCRCICQCWWPQFFSLVVASVFPRACLPRGCCLPPEPPLARLFQSVTCFPSPFPPQQPLQMCLVPCGTLTLAKL